MHARQTTKTYLGTAVLVLRVLFFLSAFHLILTFLIVLFRLCGAGLYKKRSNRHTGVSLQHCRHTTYLDWVFKLISSAGLGARSSWLLTSFHFSTVFQLYCRVGSNCDSRTQPFLVLDSSMAASFPFVSFFTLSDRYLIAWWPLLSLNISLMFRPSILDFLFGGSFFFSRWLHINCHSATVIFWLDFRFFFRFRSTETHIVLIPSTCIISSKLPVAK